MNMLKTTMLLAALTALFMALGYTLGSIIFSVAISSGNPPATMTGIFQAISKSIHDKRQGGEVEHATSASVHIRPVQAGRA